MGASCGGTDPIRTSTAALRLELSLLLYPCPKSSEAVFGWKQPERVKQCSVSLVYPPGDPVAQA